MTASRQGLQCPAPPASDLAGFPTDWLGHKRHIWRVALEERNPWYFGNGRNRFDLESPLGTCYVAHDPFAALRETIGAGIKTVSQPFIESRRFFRLRVEKTLKVADVTTNKAVPFGVTSEISSTMDYECTQSWARSFADLSLRGVLYELRFSPAGSHGCAIFGPEGSQDGKVEEVLTIGEWAVDRLYADEEIEVARLPSSDEIVILKPD